MSFCKERQKIVKKRVCEKEKGNKGRVSAPSRCVYVCVCVCVCVCVRERERERGPRCVTGRRDKKIIIINSVVYVCERAKKR